MNRSLLHREVQDFINENLNSDITKLILKGTSFKGVSTKEIVEQIEAKKRSKLKLPTWFNGEAIYFPNKLNIEQTSSERTAKYKSELVSGKSIIDLTGGLGVDSFYFSKSFNNVTHCEVNSQLSEIAKHNFNGLKCTNILCVSEDGIDYLSKHHYKYDWIYIDPSRRHNSKGKVVYLSDCLPNVPEHLDLLFKYSKNILIKASPLLDLSVGIKELKYVSNIQIVAVKNEVKELLFILNQSHSSDGIEVTTVNLKTNKDDFFSFNLEKEKKVQATFAEPQQYLYEPNAALLKAGAFKSIGNQCNLDKLHPHTHLYTSKTLINFPGRRFKINKVLPFNKRRLKYEKMSMVNITTRNFPESVETLKKRFQFKDGGNTYLFFTTNLNSEKIVLVCSKAE